jgi:hypothetical protein
MPRSDRVYDFSLRILMLALTGVLIGCIALLLWRWVQPAKPRGDVVPVTEVPAKTEPVQRADAALPASSQVLLSPGKVFRCDSGGKVTFTDRPCPTETR